MAHPEEVSSFVVRCSKRIHGIDNSGTQVNQAFVAFGIGAFINHGFDTFSSGYRPDRSQAVILVTIVSIRRVHDTAKRAWARSKGLRVILGVDAKFLHTEHDDTVTTNFNRSLLCQFL